MTKPFAIMCVGKTHSGKTTTAKQLSKKLGLTCIDMDDIDQFTKNYYPEIIEFEKENRQFFNYNQFTPFLKLQIQSIVFKYAINIGKSVILSNANSTKQAKQIQKEIANEMGIKLIAINFHIDESILKERIVNTKKDLSILTVSKSFLESLERQRDTFEFATIDDADFVFDIDASKPVITNINLISNYIDSINLLD